MTYTSVLSQSSAAQSGSLKNAALFNATFVNISPLTILTALSLKGNNSTHQYLHPLPKGNTSYCIILAKSEQNKYNLLLNICSLSLEFEAYSSPFFNLKRQELLVTPLYDSASPGHNGQHDCVSRKTNTRIYFAPSLIYENRLPLSDKQGLRFHSEQPTFQFIITLYQQKLGIQLHKILPACFIPLISSGKEDLAAQATAFWLQHRAVLGNCCQQRRKFLKSFTSLPLVGS